jgi:dTDP-L-rhamnose 4-epimerase
MHAAGVCRLVLAGSMVVYGEGRYVCTEHGVVRPEPRVHEDVAAGRFEPRCPVCGGDLVPGLVPEDVPLDPRSTYAATKVAQEHLAGAWARQTGGSVWSLRYHNVYGPRMPRDTPYAGVASIFRSALERGEPPRVLEDGRQRRDFVHVGDVARACRLALEAPRRVSGVFNIGSGDSRTVRDVAIQLASTMGRPELAPEITGRYRTGDVRHCFANIDRAREVIGFEPRVAFEEGLEELVAWLADATAIDRVDQATEELARRGLVA